MKEEITRCDACGCDINPYQVRMEVRTPLLQVRVWRWFTKTEWQHFDLCSDCWQGLRDVAVALKCLQSTTQSK